MAKFRRIIQSAWPLTPVRRAISSLPCCDEWLEDLTTLESPAFGLLDSDRLTWLSYDEFVFNIFADIYEDLHLPQPKDDLIDFFLCHAMILLIIDGYFGRPKGNSKIKILDSRSQRMLKKFAKRENLEINDKSLQQLLVNLTAEFIFGFDGLVTDFEESAKLSFLRFSYAALPVYPNDFPEKHLLTDFVQLLQPMLDQNQTYVRRESLINELLFLIYGDQEQPTFRPRLQKDLIANSRAIQDATERFSQSYNELKSKCNNDLRSYLEFLPDRDKPFKEESDSLRISDSMRIHMQLLNAGVGDYRILELIGQGAMGNVYRAFSQDNDFVAIKILRSARATQTDEITRFGREIEITMSLNHPNIARTIEYGIRDQSIYLVMELLEGGDLEDRLDVGTTISENEIWSIIRQVAQGLDYAWNHPKQFVHRDLKPGNILFDSKGQAKISDFGLAAGFSADATRLTMEGEIVGTPIYMSPEQVMGAEDVDIRSDLWSLGVIAFLALTGEYPFLADSIVDLANKVLSDPPHDGEALLAPLSDFSRGAILKLLEKKVSNRFQDPRALIDAIDAAFPTLAASQESTAQIENPAPKSVQSYLQIDNSHKLSILRGSQLNLVEPDQFDLSLTKVETEAALVTGPFQELVPLTLRLTNRNTDPQPIYINQDSLNSGQDAILESNDWIHGSESFSVRITYLPGATLLTQKGQSQAAALWLHGPFSLDSLPLSAFDWPALSGTIMFHGHDLYYVPQSPFTLQDRQIAPGTPMKLGVMNAGDVGALPFQLVHEECPLGPFRIA
ncbi:MAG: serine/threonine-protein kinase [Planctomycetota bacterium]|nr:serine/threonine-protein kinase [Planctomycetota bacterium]